MNNKDRAHVARRCVAALACVAFAALAAWSSVAHAIGGTSQNWNGWARRPWNPRDFGGSVLYWGNPDQGITIGATLLAFGTSPPPVTISRINNAQNWSADVVQVEVNDTTGGTARGQAQFRVSLDGGSNFIATGVTTAPTYAIPGTNYEIAFPVGTYTNNNVYKATAETLIDNGNAANSPTNATASAQPLIVRSGARSLLRFDGSNDRLNFPSNITADNMTIFAVTNHIAGTGYRTLWAGQKNALLTRLQGSGEGDWGTFTNANGDSGQALGSSLAIITLVVRAANDVDMYTNGGNKVTRANGSAFQNRGLRAWAQIPRGRCSQTLTLQKLSSSMTRWGPPTSRASTSI
jgi:hypothetical protein